MLTCLKKFPEKFNIFAYDSEILIKFRCRVVYIVFAFIALVMSVLNIITEQKLLLCFTAAFSFLCLFDFLLTFLSEKAEKLASVLFIIEIIILFSYFIFTGGTEGFSIIWVILLPTIGLSFFGFKQGTILCAAIFIIILSAFNIPLLKSLCVDYGHTFRLRFPFVFVSSYVVSLFLEYIRHITAAELDEAKKKYEHLYNHDQLTGLYNRYEMDQCSDLTEHPETASLGFLSFDIDLFKDINDTYGHLAGDDVLKKLGKIVLQTIPETAKAFRTGGEEFFVLYYDGEKAEKNAELLRKTVENYPFVFEGSQIKVTISLGLIIVKRTDPMPAFDQVFGAADNLLYDAKQSGRNCLKIYHR